MGSLTRPQGEQLMEVVGLEEPSLTRVSQYSIGEKLLEDLSIVHIILYNHVVLCRFMYTVEPTCTVALTVDTSLIWTLVFVPIMVILYKTKDTSTIRTVTCRWFPMVSTIYLCQHNNT